ncbi:MAG TPA: GNAT family N-acetyltransferase [Chthoniobacterales bacterium]|nr:GNAT family N-acetyltransferase [Chthoniobacterales bacterium]
MEIKLRRGTPADAPECGTICYNAFKTISEAHSFPPDFPAPEIAAGLLKWMLEHPAFYSVIAEVDGRIVGSNFLDERNPIAGVGPITVDPSVQNRAVGRRLMDAVHERAADKNFAGVRLIQAGFHTRSLSLYAKLGYDVREHLACMQGSALNVSIPGRRVRAATESDVEECNRVCRKVHGHDRDGELRDAIARATATVAQQDGRITGYATVIGFFGHAVGETNEDLMALIGAAEEFPGPGFLLPTRNGELFRWCLANRLRVIEPMTLMTRGQYQEPAGAFLPSILY